MPGTSHTGGLPVHRGAIVYKAANQVGANFTAATPIAWDSEGYDTDGFHDPAVNPERLTIPAGVKRVRLSASLSLGAMTNDLFVIAVIQKGPSGGAATNDYLGVARVTTEVGLGAPSVCLQTGIIDVSPTDYFVCSLQVETDTAVDLTAARSWFQLEVIE